MSAPPPAEVSRDPEFLSRMLPVLDRLLAYFDPVVQGFERIPDVGPFMVVGNHSGGVYMPDFWAFLSEWVHRRGPEAPLYSMGFDFTFSLPGIGDLARRIGSVPASQKRAGELLDAGHPILVYPGGDSDDYRPWTERHRVDLHGHTGFVRLALRHGVPVVPLVAHGSHDAIVVLTRGENLARWLRFDRLRINVMPIVAGPPWGIAPVQLPTWPMPAKVTARVCDPLDWSHVGPEAAEDTEQVQRCYEEIRGLMQSNLDELVEELPHPVAARLATACGLDRLTRGLRPGSPSSDARR
ncbi:MAG: lysophospholipid acyltransferase family protein [Microthrixaceae bacterium]